MNIPVRLDFCRKKQDYTVIFLLFREKQKKNMPVGSDLCWGRLDLCREKQEYMPGQTTTESS